MAELTQAQRNTLKTHILADPVLSQMVSGPGTDLYAIVVAMNADANPVVKVWKDLSMQEISDAMDLAELDNITAGAKQWAIGTILPMKGGIKATTASGRKAITDLFANSSVPNSRAAILAAATENASRAEGVLGGADASSATPNIVTAKVRNWVGDLTIQDVAQILV